VPRHSGAVLAVTSALDTSVPNMARIYNYWLGGKDHFAADRAEADRLVALYPPLPALARENRKFLIKAADWAARQGIGQFIDLGAGLPVSPSVHQAARAVLPAARVAYVDTDPVVLTHAVALLATGDGVTAVNADLRDPAAVWGHQDLRAVIDPARPVRHPRCRRALPGPGRRLRGDRRVRLADGAGQLPGPVLRPVRG
jgi:S-adenosyl methyltransferase